MIHTTVQVIRYILKDLLEPAAYLPFGIAAGGLFLLSWYLWRRYVCGEKPVRRPDRSQWLLILCVVYAAVLLKLAFFSREPGSRTGIDLIPFSTWMGGPQAHAYFIENILMFFPFGILVPARFRRLRNPLFCVDAGFLASCFLELAQLVTQRGYCQLDDIATNTLGAGIGWLIWYTMQKRFRDNQEKNRGDRWEKWDKPTGNGTSCCGVP